MTQSDLDRAVARQTGESAQRIRQMGFVLLFPAAPQRVRLPVYRRCTKKADGTNQVTKDVDPWQRGAGTELRQKSPLILVQGDRRPLELSVALVVHIHQPKEFNSCCPFFVRSSTA